MPTILQAVMVATGLTIGVGGAGGTGFAGQTQSVQLDTLGDSDDVGVRVRIGASQEFAGSRLIEGSGITFTLDANGDIVASASGGGGGLTTYPAVFRHSGSTNITTAAATVAFDTEELDPDAGHSVAAGVITVDNAGYYRVSYSVPVNDDGSGGAARGRVYAWVERDAGAGYTTIRQSRSQDYARETSGGEGISASFVCLLAAGDEIRLQIQASSSVDISTESGEAQISLNRLRAA